MTTTRKRRWLVIAGAGIGVVVLAPVLVLALGDSTAPPDSSGSSDGSAAAREASPPEPPAPSEALDRVTATSGPAKADESATGPADPIADGGTKPDRKTAQPIARPAKTKPAQSKPAQANPETRGTDPFGKGRR